jgi:hypothetical protein
MGKRIGSGEKCVMAFEYSTPGGVLRLLKAGCQWAIEFNGHRQCRWTSPDDVVMAAVRHSTGVIGWDRSRFVVSDDLLRWRPVGENL